jgi:hypothetical protein
MFVDGGRGYQPRKLTRTASTEGVDWRPYFSPVGTASANGSDTLTDFDGGLNRPPLLAPAPSVNAAALVGN